MPRKNALRTAHARIGLERDSTQEAQDARAPTSSDGVPHRVGGQRGRAGQGQGERRAQMIGPDERARREQNGDRRYGQTDLFGEYRAEDDPVAVPSEHGDDGVHISRGLRSPCHARSKRRKCEGATASRRSCASSPLTAAPSPDVKLRPLSFRTPSMTWIHACRPGPSLCARLAPAVIRLAKTWASWWIVTAPSPPSVAATSLSVSCSSAGAMVRCS